MYGQNHVTYLVNILSVLHILWELPFKPIERLRTFSSCPVCHAVCEWIPSFSLKEFPALQLSAPWLMFTRWLIWLFWVMLDKQQLISTISTSSLRSGFAPLENNLAPRLESKTESPKVPCFHAIFDLCLVFSWTLGRVPFSLSLPLSSQPSPLLFPFNSYFSTYWYSSLCSYLPPFPSLAFLSTF